MKFRKNHKIFIVIVFALFTGGIAFSQTMVQPEPTQEMREDASEKTEKWKEQLALTSKQADLMEKKIIEFAIKKDRILQSKMREEAKIERLKRLQTLENKDMRDILTQPQYDQYLVLLEKRLKEQKSGS